MFIPSPILQRLYTIGSLRNTENGTQFALKNRLHDAEVTALRGVAIDGGEVSLEHVRLGLAGRRMLRPDQVNAENPLPFPLRSIVTVHANVPGLENGKHEIEVKFEARPFGTLHLKVEDALAEPVRDNLYIPRDDADDYNPEAVRRRRALIEQASGVKLDHILHHSFDPHTVKGNCENFVGVAQVPIGFAGPLQVHGEHVDGEVLIPLATTEGTLVASYNRGMKMLNLCGGAHVTVVADAMQRAPVFVFRNARAGREFVDWVQGHLEEIRSVAESTSKVVRLQYIDPYVASKFVYLRFNFSTGDAAGQNMVGRATFAAYNWILESYPGIESAYLESNFATDKKASHVNIMRTRGKRVTAEATISREMLQKHLRVTPEQLAHHYGVANVGAFLSGSTSNALQSANAITAMFIAMGQDVANVAESSAGILYAEMTPSKDFYISLTIPSLIVATYGGGTGLATQRECLEIVGCYGRGKVNRLAEIMAGVALAGEISLGAAISSADWVSSHERLGRNR
jgi:hydroxymethylglutaryl-CoA reductase (NADPH)